MRYIFGLLLLLACLPSAGNTDRTAYLAAAAGVPVHVFDLRDADVSQRFRSFLSDVPMTNDRPLPAALIDDTVASLSFVKAVTPVDEPSYFVAAYIQKTPLVGLEEADRTRYLERYGEEVYPQQVCPIFLSRGDAGVPSLLSTAVSLPDAWFEKVQGTAENFDRLFALTEASHCGFIARELANPTVLPAGLTGRQIRTILEALGDFEATAVFRGSMAGGAASVTDEADVLSAARLIAMFLLDRTNAYTPVPGLLHEYERIGIDAAHRELARIFTSVMLARHTVRSALNVDASYARHLSPQDVAGRLQKARERGQLHVDDELAEALITSLEPALDLVSGEGAPVRTVRDETALRHTGTRLLTLTGAGIIP